MEIAVVLHNVRSLHNVGSVFRIAEAAGARKLYLSGFTPSPLDRFGKTRPQIAKTALGAEKMLLWEKVREIGSLTGRLKKEKYTILAVEQSKKSLPYYDFKPKGGMKIALILGNEVRGLPSAVLKKADVVLEIPMRGAMVRQAHHPRHSGRGKESLNVSVAAGIVLFGIIYKK